VKTGWWRHGAALLAVAAIAFSGAVPHSGPREALARTVAPAAPDDVVVAALPREAQQTLQTVKRGGPFAFERDGAVFGNYEHLLPQRSRGYYREYTVPTPGAKNRGARRIVSGRGGEYYYSDDHYRTFKRIRE
jgi:ribonuclease T1